MRSAIRMRVTWLFVAGLLFAVIPATAAIARPVSGGATPSSGTCLLPQEVLKNEPGLCAPVTASKDAPPSVERNAPSAPTSTPAAWEFAGAALLVVAALAAFVAGRRPQHAQS